MPAYTFTFIVENTDQPSMANIGDTVYEAAKAGHTHPNRVYGPRTMPWRTVEGKWLLWVDIIGVKRGNLDALQNVLLKAIPNSCNLVKHQVESWSHDD